MNLYQSQHLHDATCPHCHEQGGMAFTVDSAAHDPQLLDVIVMCSGCGTTFNDFMDINEMEVCGE